MVPQREVAPSRMFKVDNVALHDEPDLEAALALWVEARRRMPMTTEVPFECALIQLGPKRCVWYLAIHHLIGDLRSVFLITRHVAAYYDLSCAGALDTAPPLPRFEDYVEHEL